MKFKNASAYLLLATYRGRRAISHLIYFKIRLTKCFCKFVSLNLY